VELFGDALNIAKSTRRARGNAPLYRPFSDGPEGRVFQRRSHHYLAYTLRTPRSTATHFKPIYLHDCERCPILRSSLAKPSTKSYSLIG
jgi:hypothetical protein